MKTLDGVAGLMKEATAEFEVASKDLIKAIDNRAPSAYEDEEMEREHAAAKWNQAMKAIYSKAGMAPHLVSAN